MKIDNSYLKMKFHDHMKSFKEITTQELIHMRPPMRNPKEEAERILGKQYNKEVLR
jgi:hypothetical protein